MSHQKNLLYLQSKVTAFTAQQRHIQKLSSGPHPFINCLSEEEFCAQLPQARKVITWKFKKAWYDLAPHLEFIHTPSAGADWIAPDPRGKVEIIHGDFHGPIMAESLVAMMMWHSRHLGELQQAQGERKWHRDALSVTHRLGAGHHFILGYGTIARHCARVLKALGATITGVKRSPRDPQLDSDADFIIHPRALLENLGRADSLITILPDDPSTHGIVTPGHFAALKKGAYLYNLGRGNCYHQDDLLEAL